MSKTTANSPPKSPASSAGRGKSDKDRKAPAEASRDPATTPTPGHEEGGRLSPLDGRFEANHRPSR